MEKEETWQLQDAKARFSEFLEASLKKGPQVVTRRGIEAAVLIPIQEWRRLKKASRPGLKQLLLSPDPHIEKLPLTRQKFRRRLPLHF